MTTAKRAKAKKWLGPLLAAAVLGAIYYFAAPSLGPSTPQGAPKPAADFTLPDPSGRPVTLSSFRGQVVLLDFWATWCEPCLEELPDLVRFHEAHKKDGFTMLGVAMDAEGAAVIAPFVRQNKIPYPIVISGGDLPEGYSIPGFPAAFLIDRKGDIVRRYLGPKSYEELERDLAQLK